MKNSNNKTLHFNLPAIQLKANIISLVEKSRMVEIKSISETNIRIQSKERTRLMNPSNVPLYEYFISIKDTPQGSELLYRVQLLPHYELMMIYAGVTSFVPLKIEIVGLWEALPVSIVGAIGILIIYHFKKSSITEKEKRLLSLLQPLQPKMD
ncbi:MAG: hypothetical protein KDC24_14460 [Saprospiraceae bacterium]|nr:hypothetical protein [Saprospiraceae bacterium]